MTENSTGRNFKIERLSVAAWQDFLAELSYGSTIADGQKGDGL
jgi:hypothetical protein